MVVARAGGESPHQRCGAGRGRPCPHREKAPGHSVKAGDVLTIALDRSVRILKVVGFAERRGDAATARVLYDDLQERPE
jgi:ribosome-associated heat shock protein Hsp15